MTTVAHLTHRGWWTGEEWLRLNQASDRNRCRPAPVATLLRPADTATRPRR